MFGKNEVSDKELMKTVNRASGSYRYWFTIKGRSYRTAWHGHSYWKAAVREPKESYLKGN